MAKIAKVQPLVHNALIDNPATRKDDFLLVLDVYKNFITGEMTFETALKHHIELGLPSFASVIRIRRKLQAKYPELVDVKTATTRAEEETEWKDYALNH